MVAIAAGRVLKPLQKVRRSLKDFPSNPGPEQVQKFRTQLRRMEAVLDVFGLESHGAGQRLLRHERPLRVLAGKIHDMDTALLLAESLEATSAQQCRVELLELIGATRYRHARKLHRAAARCERKLVRGLEHCESRIRKQVGPRSSIRKRMIVTAKLTALIVEVGYDLACYPRLSRANLHLFRIRIRYLRRLLRIADEHHGPLYEALTEVKNAIGAWHDWERLAKTARELQGHPGCRALLAEIKAAGAAKFRRAMQASQQLRREYLARLPAKRNLQLASAQPSLPDSRRSTR